MTHARKLQHLRQALVNFANRRSISITTGPYVNEPICTIEYILHEIGHAVGLDLDMHKFIGSDIDDGVRKLPHASRDYNEAQAIAVEFFLARRLGVRLSRRRVLRFARTPLQLEWSPKTWDLYVADREKEIRWSDETINALRLIRMEMRAVRKTKAALSGPSLAP